MLRPFLKILRILTFLTILTFLPSAHAAEFFDTGTQLLFHFSDDQQAVKKSDRIVISHKDQPDVPVFEVINIASSPEVSALLDTLKLRVINAETISNRKVVGSSAVELKGRSLETSQPLMMLVLPLRTKRADSVEILYHGNKAQEYEDFLNSLQLTQGLPDTVTHPLHDEIAFVLERGIFKGYQEKDSILFKPEKTINRAELLKVLVLSSSGVDEKVVLDYVKGLANPFPDLDPKAWYAPFVTFAKKQGWVKGYLDGSFRAGNEVNLAEAMKMILTANNVTVPEDKKIWFQPYLKYLTDKNILVAEGDNIRFSFSDQLLAPSAPATRAHVAAFLARISTLREGKIKDRYVKEVSAEQLPFELPTQPQLTVYAEGSRGNQKEAYLIAQADGKDPTPFMAITAYEAGFWTGEEMKKDFGTAENATNVVLGENRSLVFVENNICAPKGCSPSPLEIQIRKNLKIRNQDLKSYADSNLDFEFLYADDYLFKPSVEGDQQTLTVNLPDGTPFMILSLIPGGPAEAESFNSQKPTGYHHIGNHDWFLYEKDTKAENRTDFIASFPESKLMVVTVTESAKLKTSLMPKAFRIMRTLRPG